MSSTSHIRQDSAVVAARDRVLAEFKRLIRAVIAAPVRDLDRWYREIAVAAASLQVPLG